MKKKATKTVKKPRVQFDDVVDQLPKEPVQVFSIPSESHTQLGAESPVASPEPEKTPVAEAGESLAPTTQNDDASLLDAPTRLECKNAISNLILSVRHLYKRSKRRTTYLPEDIAKMTRWVEQAEDLQKRL